MIVTIHNLLLGIVMAPAFVVLSGCQQDPESRLDASSRGGTPEHVSAPETAQEPDAALTGMVGTAPQVTAVWNDYEDQLKTAVVKLPSTYDTPPTLFRQRGTGEPVEAYLRAAVVELRRVSSLRIPAGHYEIAASGQGSSAVLSIINMSDKVLDFSHSTISLYEPRTLFNLRNLSRFTLKNVRIVHRYPLASAGMIDIKDGAAIPRVAADYRARLKNVPTSFSKISAIYQAHPSILSGQAPFMWRKEGSSFRLIDENLLSSGIVGWSSQTGHYQIQANHELLRQTLRLGGQGTRLLIKHQSYGANGISAQGGSDLSFEGIKINGVGGMGFYISDVDSGVLIRNCIIKANKAEDQLALFGTTVDGIHLARVGSNVIIRDNMIADTGDDGINIYHGNFFKIESGSGSEITVRRLGGGAPQTLTPNLLVAVYTNNLMLKKNAIRITSVRELPGLNGAQRFLLTHASGYNGFVANSDLLTIGEHATGRVFVGHNTIRNSTARGVLIQAKEVILKSNIFEDIARSAIKITSDTRWFNEYGLPSNIKIFDNTISNTTWDHLDIDTWSTAPAAITALVEIDPTTRGDKKPYGLTGAIKNLSIIQNKVTGSPASLGHFGVAHIKIFSNLFESHSVTLSSKRPGSAYGWFITGPVFGENAQDCQATQTADCGQ